MAPLGTWARYARAPVQVSAATATGKAAAEGLGARGAVILVTPCCPPGAWLPPGPALSVEGI